MSSIAIVLAFIAAATLMAISAAARDVAIRWLVDRADARVKRCSESETTANAAMAMAQGNDAKVRMLEKAVAQLSAPTRKRL